MTYRLVNKYLWHEENVDVKVGTLPAQNLSRNPDSTDAAISGVKSPAYPASN